MNFIKLYEAKLRNKKNALNSFSHSTNILGTMGEIDESKARGQFAAGTGLLVLLLAKGLLR